MHPEIWNWYLLHEIDLDVFQRCYSRCYSNNLWVEDKSSRDLRSDLNYPTIVLRFSWLNACSNQPVETRCFLRPSCPPGWGRDRRNSQYRQLPMGYSQQPLIIEIRPNHRPELYSSHSTFKPRRGGLGHKYWILHYLSATRLGSLRDWVSYQSPRCQEKEKESMRISVPHLGLLRPSLLRDAEMERAKRRKRWACIGVKLRSRNR